MLVLVYKCVIILYEYWFFENYLIMSLGLKLTEDEIVKIKAYKDCIAFPIAKFQRKPIVLSMQWTTTLNYVIIIEKNEELAGIRNY